MIIGPCYPLKRPAGYRTNRFIECESKQLIGYPTFLVPLWDGVALVNDVKRNGDPMIA